MEPGRLRHHCPEIFPQSRGAGALDAGRGRRGSVLAVAAHGRCRGDGGIARGSTLRRRDRRPRGFRPDGRDLDLLGLEGRLFRRRGGRLRLLRRDPADAGAADGRPELAAMVQHRAPLGLWHRRPGAGPLLRRLPQRRADGVDQRLRAPAAACLLYPVGRRRSRQRGRDHGFVGARGADLQIRLGLGLELLEIARRRRAPVGRRAVVRADELSAHRRPRGRRDQIGRHDEACGQDGDRRHRPPRHRGVYRLEGRRGAEGRRARRRLQARRPASEPGHGRLSSAAGGRSRPPATRRRTRH